MTPEFPSVSPWRYEMWLPAPPEVSEGTGWIEVGGSLEEGGETGPRGGEEQEPWAKVKTEQAVGRVGLCEAAAQAKASESSNIQSLLPLDGEVKAHL